MSRILLLKLGGLGDLFVALPSLNLVRQSFPGARIDLVARATYGALLRERGVVDAVLSADDAARLPLFREPISASESNHFLDYDLVFGWFLKNPELRTPAENSIHRENGVAGAPLPLLSSVTRWIVYDPSAGRPLSRDFFEQTLEFVREKGRPELTFEECARLPRADVARRDRYAVIHPGSGSEKKCWPLERFLAAAAFLSTAGYAGQVVTGEAEECLEEKLAGTRFPDGWDHTARPSLSALAELLESASLYLGNDSGVTHLASACGARVIAIFLRENEEAWAPLGRARVLSADAVSDIPLERIVEAISEFR